MKNINRFQHIKNATHNIFRHVYNMSPHQTSLGSNTENFLQSLYFCFQFHTKLLQQNYHVLKIFIIENSRTEY